MENSRNTLCDLPIVLPVNADTLDYLRMQAVTGREHPAPASCPTCVAPTWHVIAARLEVGDSTVKKQMGNIFDKLRRRNRSELVSAFWAQKSLE